MACRSFNRVTAPKHVVEAESIDSWVVTPDFKHFRNKPLSGAAFNLQITRQYLRCFKADRISNRRIAPSSPAIGEAKIIGNSAWDLRQRKGI
jgi:hypothetical protein